MRISPNYTLDEFQRSETAKAKGINNVIPAAAVNAIRILVKHLLQPINDATGWKNKINSGYRSPELNKAVGGVPTSMHMNGEAADCMFFVPGGDPVEPVEVARRVLAMGLEFDQMIVYPTFVHLSFTARRKNRNQFLYNRAYQGPKL